MAYPKEPTAESRSASRPLRRRLAQMLFIKRLIRSGILSPAQASLAIQAGAGGASLRRFLQERGWASPAQLREALIALRAQMREFA